MDVKFGGPIINKYCRYYSPIDLIVGDYVNHPKILEYETLDVRGQEEGDVSKNM